MSNTRVNEDVKQNVNKKIEDEIQITPPENYDVMLVNSHTHFHAIRDLLKDVLEITEARAWQIVLKAHNDGMASVYTGPKDMADQYQQSLMEHARARIEAPDEMGYGNINFIVEKVKK